MVFNHDCDIFNQKQWKGFIANGFKPHLILFSLFFWEGYSFYSLFYQADNFFFE